MDLESKLQILTEGAKYDVACTSSGVNRGTKAGMTGTAKACGICHTVTSDGRCVSLLKILLTNACMYDCQYCVNRRSNPTPRATLTPNEIADLTMNFYRRNYIEGLFLSSGIIKNPDYTMELLIETLHLLRTTYRFNGYIHAKAIPGADEALITALGHLADRMSVNLELPSETSLITYAPEKSKTSIIAPMKYVKQKITQTKEELSLYRHAQRFVPAGQSTQMIIGATPESDSKIIHLSQGLYKQMGLKRVFYSAYIPVNTSSNLPTTAPALTREHRLYQADWLIRTYGFNADEIFASENENLSLHLDPKCHWALRNLGEFPVEINQASYRTLLRVPGIGQTSASRIMAARRAGRLDFVHLKKIGVVLKRAKYFILCSGKPFDAFERFNFNQDLLEMRLSDKNMGQAPYSQLALTDMMG